MAKLLRGNLQLIAVVVVLVSLMLYRGNVELLLRSLSFIVIWSVVVVPLNLLTGWLGILAWTQAGAAAIGGYVAALLVMELGIPWPVGMLSGMVAMALVGAMLGLPSLRVKGHQFMVLNFAFMIVITQVIINMDWLTRGADGLWPIPRPRVFGWVPKTPAQYIVFCLPFLAAVSIVCWRIATSPLGRAYQAVRDDEIAAEALGKDVIRIKVTAFMLVSALGAVAGALYAFYVTALDPAVFDVHQSIYVGAMVILGGVGSLVRGSILGVAVLLTAPLLISLYISLPRTIEAPFRGLLYGVMLIVLMMFRPQGLMGKAE